MPIKMQSPHLLTPRVLQTTAFTYGKALVLVQDHVSLVFKTKAGKQYQWVFSGDKEVKDIKRLKAVVADLQGDGYTLVLRDERKPAPVATQPEEQFMDDPAEETVHYCAGVTKKGTPCKRVVKEAGCYCPTHEPVAMDPALSNIDKVHVDEEEKSFVPRPDSTDELMNRLGLLTAARSKKG